jgi:hypothetical protein
LLPQLPEKIAAEAH